MTTGDRIKYYRKQAGLTQSELGKKLHTTGACISSWETDRTEPNLGQIVALAEFFDLNITDIVVPKEPDYYANKETLEMAQAIFDNPDLRILFDAAQNSKANDLKMAADLLTRLKETNPDG